MAIFRRGPRPLTAASNAGGAGKNPDSRRIAGYRSMTDGGRTTTATVHCVLYRTDRASPVRRGRPCWL